MIERFYRWLWSHTAGRPYTYIIRDSWHKFECLWILGLIACGAAATHYFGLVEVLKALLILAFGFIGGHLFWGTKWIENQGGKGEGE